MTDARTCFACGPQLCADVRGARLRAHGLDASHARPLGAAWLPDHALWFDDRHGAGGQACAPEVRPLRGSVVPGALLALTPRARAALGGDEAGATAGPPRDTEVILPGGAIVPAIVLAGTAVRPGAYRAPSGACLQSVERGCAEWGHDPAPLRRAAADGSGAAWVDAVFVYGTLLRGESNAAVLHGRPVRRVLEASVRGALLETGEPYPVMVLDEASTVHGEWVELDDVHERLGPLDALEGFDGYGAAGMPGRLYHRTLVDVTTAEGPRRAWTYVAGETVGRGARIASGSWRAHRRASGPDAAREPRPPPG